MADHLDAPGLMPPSGDPSIDITDIYAFKKEGEPKSILMVNVNPLTLSGTVTRTVYAGPPEAMSRLALPGMTRVFRIDAGRLLGNVLHLRGAVDDRSQLRLGESSLMDFRIDRIAGIIHAPFFGTTVPLRLETR